MITESFSVLFHQPFLVRSGLSRGVVDALARVDSPVPASSVKGAMRAACTNVLGVDAALVAEIFGQEGRLGGVMGSSAWAWTHAGPRSSFQPQIRARNRVDINTGVAQPEALTFSEEWWQDDSVEASFAVEQVQVLDPSQLERHRVVLQVAAYAVTALGSWRNRGMGAVTVRPLERLDALTERWKQVVR